MGLSPLGGFTTDGLPYRADRGLFRDPVRHRPATALRGKASTTQAGQGPPSFAGMQATPPIQSLPFPSTENARSTMSSLGPPGPTAFGFPCSPVAPLATGPGRRASAGRASR